MVVTARDKCRTAISIGLFYLDHKQRSTEGLSTYSWESAAQGMKFEYRRRANNLIAELLKEANT